jgi:hypothetical protein
MKQAFVSSSADADMQAVPIALMRAAQRARDLARQTGTQLVVVADGKLMELDPDSLQSLIRGDSEVPTDD